MSTSAAFDLFFIRYWEKFYQNEDQRGICVYSAMLRSLKSMMNNYCKVSPYGVNNAIVKKWVRRFGCVHLAQKHIDDMDNMISELEHACHEDAVDQKHKKLANLYISIIKQYMQVLTENETASFLKIMAYRPAHCEKLFII
jgi:hypothetical protein